MGTIIYGPQGSGKTLNAGQIAKYFNKEVVDDFTWPLSGKANADKFKKDPRIFLVTAEEFGIVAGADLSDKGLHRVRHIGQVLDEMEKAGIQVKRPRDLNKVDDPVNHPVHYQSEGGIECIDAIRAALGRDGFIAFLKGQVVKYTWRAGKKGDQAIDAEKAQWYQNKLVGVLREQA